MLDKSSNLCYTTNVCGALNPPFFRTNTTMVRKQHTHKRTLQFVLPLLASFAFGSGVVAFTAHATVPDVREGSAENVPIVAVTSTALSALSIPTDDALTSAVITPDFAVNGVGGYWPTALTENGISLHIRAWERDHWTPWYPLDPLRDAPNEAGPRNGVAYSEPMFFSGATKLQFRAVGSLAENALAMFSDIGIIYFDTTAEPHRPLSWVRRLLQQSVRATAPLTIRSRADWGADESYRLDGESNEIWARTYQPVQKFIIHHTAGSDGGDDPAATVRGIYYYHAKVVNGTGWGDIGYNYLIDPAGTVYEGRYGGDGVVGGHTYNSATDVNYNYGSAGIALLGNFESSTPSAAAQEALATLVAQKGWLHRVAPNGTGFFLSGDLPNVVGHGDVDSTLCPGKNLRSQLANVRSQAQTQYDTLGPQSAFQPAALIVSQSAQDVYLSPGGSATVSVDAQNTGNLQWQRYIADRAVRLIPVTDGTPSPLQHSAWTSSTIVGLHDDANVPAAATTRFSFVIAAPSTTTEASQTFALAGPDGAELPNTRFTINAHVTNVEYGATLDISEFPATMYVRDVKRVAVKVTNTAGRTWQRGEVKLQLFTPGSADAQPSVFRAASWPTTLGDFDLDQNELPPGAVGTFTVPLISPKTFGDFTHRLKLVRADGGPIIAADATATIRTETRWKAKLENGTFRPAVRRKWSQTVTLKFTNTGAVTWKRNVRLTILNAKGKTSAFAATGWPSTTGGIAMQEQRVAPGGTGTFVVRLKAPRRTGLYRTVFRLDRPDTGTPLEGSVVTVKTRVD